MAIDKSTDDFCTALHEAIVRIRTNFGGDAAERAKTELNAIYGRPSIEMKIEKRLADEEEWIWVEGYKGTEHDMTCRGYQFALGGQTDMPEDVPIELCRSGFHFCLNLRDVFRHYSIGSNNRFFKVRGLVRKSDYEGYGKGSNLFDYKDKLVAKSIIFLSECGLDEIFDTKFYDDWTEDEKRLALQEGVEAVKNEREINSLVGVGYTRPFANWLVRNCKYEIAFAVGSQPDLSMDMKCLAIFGK